MNVDRIAEIKRLEAEAPGLLAPWEANRWATAELYAQELAAEKTLRGLAAEISTDQVPVSHTHVRYMAKIWQIFGNLGFQDRPPFNEAYHSEEVRSSSPVAPEPMQEEEAAPVNRYRFRRSALKKKSTISYAKGREEVFSLSLGYNEAIRERAARVLGATLKLLREGLLEDVCKGPIEEYISADPNNELNVYVESTLDEIVEAGEAYRLQWRAGIAEAQAIAAEPAQEPEAHKSIQQKTVPSGHTVSGE